MAFAVTVAALPAPARAETGVKGFSSQLTNLEDAIGRLTREFANPLAIVRKFPFQKRLIDARVFYELGNYESAAIVLLDVVDNPAFAGNLELEAAQFLLAQCLLKINNPKAATDTLRAVARGRDAALAEQARFHLIDMALTANDDEELRNLVTEMGGSATSDQTRYGLGKAYLRLDDPDKAILWLGVIGPQSTLFREARYYLAVAYTAKGQLAQALDLFKSLAATAGEGEAQAELRDLAWLGVGRLQVELGDVASALTSYQQIGRYSPHYEVALYEMAWAYIKEEQYDKALLTVDILLLTVADEQINVDAHVLRGRLNIMMNDYDEAMDSYTAIINRFAPIRNELVRFTRNPQEIQRYFQWLLERRTAGEDQARLSAPLSERTSKWIESTRDIGRVAAVFDRISGESRDISQAKAVGEELERILSAKNRVELFPNLRDGWTRALVLENRLVLLSSAILDAQAEIIRGRLGPADSAELQELLAWRRSLDERAQRLPTTFEAYDKRQAKVTSRYRDLERKNFMVEQSLAQVKRQLLALERYVNDKQYADEGEKLSPEREAEIRSEIDLEKAALQELFDELTALKRDIQIEARRVGTGDTSTEGEQNLKQALIAAHVREGQFYDRVGLRVGGGLERGSRQYAEFRQRILGGIARLDGVIAEIDDEVGLKTAELRGQVSREMGALRGYSVEVSVYDSEGRELSRAMGEELFNRARSRMDQVVLEADVGILDVVWEKKQRATQDLQKVNEQRADRLRQLSADLKALREGAGDEPVERRAPAEVEETP
ncbi:MAG: tetratricopeptide repeat protein [Deltaproteobacteria bacterium]|nr:MAG: tetratricopeptide repeat protein [Deltaproteobacteria bacterium]